MENGRKGSKIRQKPEIKQGRRKSIGEKCGMPRGKCTVQRGGIIWGKGEADNIENRRRI